MQIPPEAAQILAALHAAGHQAYLVGGCVRDMLLHRVPKDWDVATDARPEQLTRLFTGAEQIGAHFGVILWHGVEIATFRSDGPYSDGRHPESVQFESDPAKDAGRRDFTINGLFFDVRSERILDFTGGQRDLAAGLIRAIGDPEERFAEDHLRLLRAVRFAARFGFELETRTAAAIRAHSGAICGVAAERVREELTKILTEPHPRRGLELLDTLELLPHILPEIQALQGVEQPPEFHPEGDVWTHTLIMLDALQEPSITLALGVLLHDIAKPATLTRTDRIRFPGHAELGARMTGEILRRFRYPAAVVERVQSLVGQHMRFLDVRNMRESTRKRFLRQSHFPELLELHRIDCASSHGRMEAYDFCRREIAALPPEALHPRRLLTGDDLLALGIPAGPRMGRLLRALEDAQLEGTIRTADEARALVAAEGERES
jgi:poly(A) polymerase